MMKSIKAFSLLELLTALTILIILLAIAIPAVRHLLTQNHTAVDVNQLLTAVNYTRNEAITRGETIMLCKSNNQHTCNGNWQDGQIVLDAQNHVLRSFPPLSRDATLSWNSSGKNRDAYLKFQATGFTEGQRGSFYYCVDKGTSKVIVVEDTGRTRIMALTNADYVSHCS